MKAFLQELAEEIYLTHSDLSKVTVVFPNRRAAIYFRKYLGEIIARPVFSPTLLTFEDFVSSYSSLHVPDKLELVAQLHVCYTDVMGLDAEPFDSFFLWGEMLLRDFDETDKYLVDAKVLFADLSHLKELDSGLDYLSEEQRTFLQNFWQGFDDELSANKQKFLSVWQRLYPLYKKFREHLLQKQLAYEGMLHRAVAEEIVEGKLKFSFPVTEKKQLWFAGFNALTSAEERIISYAVENGMATARWDTDQFYLNNAAQEAGDFFRAHIQHPVLGKTFPPNFPNHFREEKDVQLFSAAQQVGQVKLMAQILEQELKNGMRPEETVIILPDEKLLMTVLHSIAPVVEKLNVTMGFPLASSPVFNLVEMLVELQIACRAGSINFRQVQAVLSHPYVAAADVAAAQNKLREIARHNWVSIPEEFLTASVPLHAMLFQESASLVSYLIEALNAVVSLPTLDGFDREYILRGLQLLNRLDAVWRQDSAEPRTIQLKSFLRLFRQYARAEKIPFTGEPLRGLQVMGVLETRSLDYKNVFMLSLNEGIFPSSGNKGSYVPYSIRKAYGLPTPEYQGSIYAYLFYRSLQRANRIFLFYNSEPDVLGQGEMSRYLQQLIYESGLKINSAVMHNTVQPQSPQPIVIRKDENVLKALAGINESNLRSRGLSPSALNTYIECRLKFYFQYIVRIREPLKVEEEIDARVLGNFLHRVMEKFYHQIIERKKSKTIDADDFDTLDPRIDRLIDEAFIEGYNLDKNKTVTYEGQRVVVREVVKRFALEIIRYDKQQAPFTIEALEQKGWLLNKKISHSPGFVVLGGTIDRVDKKGDIVRVIDYKTGRDELEFKNVESLFYRDGKRNKAAFQTLLYALLYRNNNPVSEEMKIVPGLINRKNLFDEDFHFGLTLNKKKLDDATPLFAEFEERLQILLEEIFDPAGVFDQTDKMETCKLCAYKEICYR
ncbi:MAG: PD-(D/E)XK nuclease family protein [Bacteroidetes bacterium]|nr:PD-(D/E)XK nuclease family protein [Bacteroidota bacterium]